jgi:hypothetical protein
MNDFHSKLAEYIKSKELKNANDLIMREIGKCLVRSKGEFVDLLNYSGINASSAMTDGQLIALYIDNIDGNEKLLIGTAYLVNKSNQVLSFDGEDEISDTGVKRTIQILYNYFDDTPEFAESDPNEDFYATSEDFSNGAGVVGAIAGAVGAGATLGTKIAEGRQKKKYGALDIAQKKMDAKQALVQSVIQQKQAQTELKKKETEESTKKLKVWGMVIGGIVIVGILAFVIYKKNKATQPA